MIAINEQNAGHYGREYIIAKYFGKDYLQTIEKAADEELLALGRCCVVVCGGDGEVSTQELDYIVGLLAQMGASPRALDSIQAFAKYGAEEEKDLDGLVKELGAINVKCALWHAVCAAAVDGLHDDEIESFRTIGSKLGVMNSTLTEMEALFQKKQEAFFSRMATFFPEEEDPAKKVAEKPLEDDSKALHLGDSTNFAGRPKSSSLVMDGFDEKKKRLSCMSYFFRTELNMESVPPARAYPAFFTTILALVGGGEINQQEQMAFVYRLCADYGYEDYGWINKLVNDPQPKMTPLEVKETLLTHQCPFAAYNAISISSADGDLTEKELDYIQFLFSETHVDKKQVEDLLMVYKEEMALADEISAFLSSNT
uniref:Co-chaperone DjlA N-terminal domain-containing protein n=1 Tax=Trieres chinensis TaxID=1514140 RepID=A0A7S2ECI3_TRICV